MPIMVGDTTVLIEAPDLLTPAALARTADWTRQFFREHFLPQPPLPENFLTLAPCSLLVTETEGEAGLRTGRIKIAGPDGAVLYEQEWLITAGEA
jgi:hypothetical protein